MKQVAVNDVSNSRNEIGKGRTTEFELPILCGHRNRIPFCLRTVSHRTMQDLPISMGDERDVFERQERRNPVIVVLTRSNGRKRGRTLSTRRRGRRRCELGQTDTQSGPRSFTPHCSIQQSLLRRKTLSVSSIGDSAREDSSLR